MFEQLADRPLELTTARFRQVGHGTAIRITPDQVSFEPGTLGKGDDTFVVRVKRGSAGNGIYEGELTSATGEPVTDKVMPTGDDGDGDGSPERASPSRTGSGGWPSRQ